MPIGAIGETVQPGTARRRASERPIDADFTVVESQTLVPVAPVTRSENPATRARPLATFVAQLIATDMDLPQTRARRRADLAAVEAAYAETMAEHRPSRLLAVL